MSEHEVIAPVSPEESDGPDDQDVSSAFAEAFTDGEPRSEAPVSSEEGDGPAGDLPESGDSGEVIPEELRHAGQRYDTMAGRLRKEREELERKAQEYEAIKAELKAAQDERRKITEALIQARQQQPVQQQPAPQAAPARQQPLPMAEIPDEIKDEAKVFEREYPELAPLLRYPGKEGEKLRKLLGEYGSDVAATHGNSVMAQYKLSQTESQMRQQLAQFDQRAQRQQQEMQQRLENERRQAHYTQIYEAVPGYAAIAVDPSRRAELEQFHAALSDWVDAKPHREASRMLEILRQGDAPSVVNVLKTFQHEQSNGRPEAAEAARRSAARAATAVPSRVSTPPRGRPDPNDTYAAFREAFGSGR